jgi:hypothetical protein
MGDEMGMRGMYEELAAPGVSRELPLTGVRELHIPPSRFALVASSEQGGSSGKRCRWNRGR